MKSYRITDASSKKNIGKVMNIDGVKITIGRTTFTSADNVYEDNQKELLNKRIQDKKYLRLWKDDNLESTGTYICSYELIKNN
tara:strand:+ start:548 stop:796 length:249 start_codon:yes stop_codon:yes gene_type:complete